MEKKTVFQKAICVLLAVCLSVFFFSGCGKDTEDLAEQTSPEQSSSAPESSSSQSTSTVTASTKTSSKTTTSKKTTSKQTNSEEEIVLSERDKVLFGLDTSAYPACLEYAGNSARIANLMKKAEKGGHYVIGVLGGSITQGAGASSLSSSYGNLVRNWWQENFPKATFDFISAGIGSTNPEMACYRLDADLLAYKPDFVVIDFAVNTYLDHNVGVTYQTLLYRILSQSNAPAVMAIQFTSCDRTGYNAGIYKKGGTYPNAAISNALKIYQVPSVSYHNYIWKVIEKRTIAWYDIGSDYIHPNDDGHRIAASLINSHLAYVKANLASLAKAAPAVTAPASDAYLKLGYITGNTAGVTASNCTVLGGGERSYHGWKLNQKGSSITATIPAGLQSVVIFMNASGCTGTLKIKGNGTSEEKTVSASSAATPTLVSVFGDFGTKITITSDMTEGSVTVFGIGYSKS